MIVASIGNSQSANIPKNSVENAKSSAPRGMHGYRLPDLVALKLSTNAHFKALQKPLTMEIKNLNIREKLTCGGKIVSKLSKTAHILWWIVSQRFSSLVASFWSEVDCFI